MKLIHLFLAVLTLFLFYGGPDYESHRIIQHVWDTGHYILFAGLSFTLLQSHYFKKLSIPYSLFLIIVFSLVLGIFIELLQIFVNRDFELTDIISDLLGAIIGFLIASLYEKRYVLNSKIKTIIIICLIIIIGFSPLFVVIIDEINMRNEFPVLADLSSDSQLSRWDVNKADLFISRDIQIKGENTLLVSFQPGKYPDVTLQHFMRNWSGYEYIYFRLFNPELKLIEIEIKIYDYFHTKKNYKRSDRFNMVVQLKDGWNEIKIPLTEVKNSPIKRKMDLSKIKSLSLFLNNLTQPVKLYLSPIELI